MAPPPAIPVADLTAAGEVRRRAVDLAESIGLDATLAGSVAVVATELGTNLARHAREGQVLFRTFAMSGTNGLELLAIDRGPGMADVAACLRDGYSTAGSLGQGLGAMRRMASLFELYSVAGIGTVQVAQFWPGGRRSPQAPPADEPMEVGAVCQPHPGETVCGDAWAVVQASGRCAVLVVDGLGHGLHAAEAAGASVRAFTQHARLTAAEIVESVHQALRGTRGAAAAVAIVDLAARSVDFCGIGNIAASLRGPGESQQMVSLPGILGQEVRKLQPFFYPWPNGACLIIHSDGLGSRWDLDAYPGLLARHPSLVAGRLYGDHRRERDDVTVLALRERRGGGA